MDSALPTIRSSSPADVGAKPVEVQVASRLGLRKLPARFPYKPTTYFIFPWWLGLAALGFAISVCVLGAALPPRRAARMEPARVLSGN